ncbi:UNVERIFIED_CONTAM: hypothetical protein Sradi_3948400 [Sesamum radiatum]|uniref:Uncharacterized protein n=1 Tax=Sesamum radiatum TaxID=300843 RepID=A0AAW2PIP7_SESRA
MAAPEAEEREHSSWEELLRKMLPEGAPLPDEDQLDYSISVDFIGPSPFFTPPVVRDSESKIHYFPEGGPVADSKKHRVAEVLFQFRHHEL